MAWCLEMGGKRGGEGVGEGECTVLQQCNALPLQSTVLQLAAMPHRLCSICGAALQHCTEAAFHYNPFPPAATVPAPSCHSSRT